MIKLLHTSDWHIGAKLNGISRADDHTAFFKWLVETVTSENITALLVAGDIFDIAQPSAESEALYYDCLVALGKSSLREIVILGGNHDSAARLEAPKTVLKALNVHVVARYSREREENLLVPLHEEDGSVGAVVVALPFVNEFRLGVRTTGVDSDSLRETIADKFRGLYRLLCDRALELFGDLPLIGMGHLTVGGDVKLDDSPLQVHMVGTIGGLPVSIFDERLRYVALGHIHRMLPVQTGSEREVWYSGTPIPVRFSEARIDRKALVVTVDDRKTYHPETLTIPTSRELLEIRGDFSSVSASVSALTNSAPLPTLLKITLEVDQFQATLASQLNDALDHRFEQRDLRPIIADIVQVTSASVERSVGEVPVLTPAEMNPVSVFQQLCTWQGEDFDELRPLLEQLIQSGSEA